MPREICFPVALAAFFCLGLVSTPGAQQVPAAVRIPETSLRSLAIHTERPEFPTQMLRQGIEGVAVAEVRVNAGGTVETVRILESPHPDITAAVEKAVRQWKFKPQTVRGVPVKIVGKLTFYFRIEAGAGSVLYSV